VAGDESSRLADEVTAIGHTVECRAYLEDREAGFRPASGHTLAVAWPDGVRVEAAFDGAGPVPSWNGPAELVAHGPYRAAGVWETGNFDLTTNFGFLSPCRWTARPASVAAGASGTALSYSR
jgi:acetyl-CoA/propionyl-CoA carboxylase, biotin carboxylase, biotin carboxyl carrier protein